MKNTVDKFGRFRGYQAQAGPPGVGFVLDEDGNYDMMNKRLRRVTAGTEMQDVVTYQQLEPHVKMLLMLNKSVHELLPDRLPPLFEEFMKEQKEKLLIPLVTETLQKKLKEKLELEGKEVLVPMVKVAAEEVVKEKTTAIAKSVTNTMEGKFKPKLDRLERELEKIKKEAHEELKSLSDVTRAFIYKITSPGYARNSPDQETVIRSKIKEKGSTWQHIFPEVTKKS